MKCLTSFSPDGYEKYGRRFLETYTEHHDVPITVYVEDVCDFEHPLVTYKNLYEVEGCVEFINSCQFPILHGLQLDGSRVYQYNAVRFCRKVFSQIDAAQGGGWLYWLDADIEFDGPIDFPQPNTFLVYLGRENHSCTSFIGFNLDHEVSPGFWNLYRKFYEHGLVFTLPEWHDCAVLDTIREAVNLPSVSLTSGKGNVFDEAFPNAHHRKGVWKLNYKTRYDELLDLVREVDPKSILEIGTFDGGRAVAMCANGAEYVGFDLFKEATPLSDNVEKNVKPHHCIDSVSQKLAAAQIKHKLISGNTRETLPEFEGGPFDFAFIDGGHSIETIQSDWDNVKKLMRPGSLVVFDDYYEGIPVDEHGANAVVANMNYRLSEMADPVAGGGRTRLAIVEVS